MSFRISILLDICTLFLISNSLQWNAHVSIQVGSWHVEECSVNPRPFFVYPRCLPVKNSVFVSGHRSHSAASKCMLLLRSNQMFSLARKCHVHEPCGANITGLRQPDRTAEDIPEDMAKIAAWLSESADAKTMNLRLVQLGDETFANQEPISAGEPPLQRVPGCTSVVEVAAHVCTAADGRQVVAVRGWADARIARCVDRPPRPSPQTERYTARLFCWASASRRPPHSAHCHRHRALTHASPPPKRAAASSPSSSAGWTACPPAPPWPSKLRV